VIVGIVGHAQHGKTTLAQALARAGAPFQVVDPADWGSAGEWSGAILVVDATQGAMPGTKAALIEAKQAHLRGLVVFMNRAGDVDPEILDLVKMELEEMITAHGPHGVKASIVTAVPDVLAAARNFH
jgi:elongation factor Tu